MDEKRRSPRLKEDNEVTIIVVSGGKNSVKEKVIYPADQKTGKCKQKKFIL